MFQVRLEVVDIEGVKFEQIFFLIMVKLINNLVFIVMKNVGFSLFEG